MPNISNIIFLPGCMRYCAEKGGVLIWRIESLMGGELHNTKIRRTYDDDLRLFHQAQGWSERIKITFPEPEKGMIRMFKFWRNSV